MKPMLASNYDEHKLRYPIIAQPKTDGVRALFISPTLTGRSLKRHANVHTTMKFSTPEFYGLDGEMYLGPRENWISPSLCRDTTSALNSIKGSPDIYWKVFDLVTPDTVTLPYQARLDLLYNKVMRLNHPNIVAVPYYVVHNLEALLNLDARFLEQGFEGTILRDPRGHYKEGRSTVKEGGLLRIKRFVEEEAFVHDVIEGQMNNNEAQTNELGRTERSTHQENMEPNGLIGALSCRDMKTGAMITVSAGAMTHDERKAWFQNQKQIIGKIIKYKTFPKGVKDKPRFPTFVCIRAESDMP